MLATPLRIPDLFQKNSQHREASGWSRDSSNFFCICIILPLWGVSLLLQWLEQLQNTGPHSICQAPQRIKERFIAISEFVGFVACLAWQWRKPARHTTAETKQAKRAVSSVEASNEWMCIYIRHISQRLMEVYNSYYWVRSNVSLWHCFL